jgi:putative transposase
MYFVTMCTADRMPLFGEIRNAGMWLNSTGKLVEAAWSQLPTRYPALDLDAFIVMPNHLHEIIILHATHDKFTLVGAGSPRPPSPPAPNDAEKDAVIAPLSTNLGKVVAYFKYQSAKLINASRRTPGAPVWQRNYYDHIIRRGDSLNRIRRYIAENPARWPFDPENPAAAHPKPEDIRARI